MVKTSILNVKAKLNSNTTLIINTSNKTEGYDDEIGTNIAMTLALTSGLVQVNHI